VDGVVLIYTIICVMCGRCGVIIQHYMHNRKTCSVDIHLDNPLSSLQLFSRSTYLLYPYNQQIHPNFTKPLPLPHTLNHQHSLYFHSQFLRHQQTDSWRAVLTAIMELHGP